MDLTAGRHLQTNATPSASLIVRAHRATGERAPSATRSSVTRDNEGIAIRTAEVEHLAADFCTPTAPLMPVPLTCVSNQASGRLRCKRDGNTAAGRASSFKTTIERRLGQMATKADHEPVLHVSPALLAVRAALGKKSKAITTFTAGDLAVELARQSRRALGGSSPLCRVWGPGDARVAPRPGGGIRTAQTVSWRSGADTHFQWSRNPGRRLSDPGRGACVAARHQPLHAHCRHVAALCSARSLRPWRR
jgi:hypothetical protein